MIMIDHKTSCLNLNYGAMPNTVIQCWWRLVPLKYLIWEGKFTPCSHFDFKVSRNCSSLLWHPWILLASLLYTCLVFF